MLPKSEFILMGLQKIYKNKILLYIYLIVFQYLIEVINLDIYNTVNRVCIPTLDCLKFELLNGDTYNLQKGLGNSQHNFTTNYKTKRLRKEPLQFFK